MATKTFAELTAGSTPLAGTELVPIWQSGGAKQVPADAFDLAGAAAAAAAASLAKTANLADLPDAATARTSLGLGTAAVHDVGTAAGNVVQMDFADKLPAVDGSQLTNLPAPSGLPQATARFTIVGGAISDFAGTNIASIVWNSSGNYTITFTAAIIESRPILVTWYGPTAYVVNQTWSYVASGPYMASVTFDLGSVGGNEPSEGHVVFF